MIRKIENIFLKALFVPLLGASCSSDHLSEEHDAPEFYDLSEYENVKVDDILEVAEMVPLLFERDTYLKKPTYVSFLDSNIVIEEQENKIHVFSVDGHYIGCSKSMYGQGPGEHTTLIGHVVNPFRHSIDVMTYYKMVSYAPEFTRCERESAIPTIVGSADKLLYDDGIALSESLYLLHSSIVTNPYKVTLYDAAEGKELQSWSYNDDVIVFFHRLIRKFFRIPDGEILISGEGYTPYIYGVDKDGKNFYKAIEFKYNDKTITDHVTVDDFRKDHHIWEKYIPKNELPEAQYLNSRTILTVIGTGADPYRDKYTIVTDRANGKNYRFESVEDGVATIPSIHTMDENYIYSVYSKERILENPGYVLNKAGEADSLLSGIDDEDFVLVKYRFKK